MAHILAIKKITETFISLLLLCVALVHLTVFGYRKTNIWPWKKITFINSIFGPEWRCLLYRNVCRQIKRKPQSITLLTWCLISTKNNLSNGKPSIYIYLSLSGEIHHTMTCNAKLKNKEKSDYDLKTRMNNLNRRWGVA